MTSKEAKGLLDRFLTPMLAELGYRRVSALDYEREVNNATAGISFMYHWDRRGFGAFIGTVGVRYEEFMRWLPDDPTNRRSTLWSPVHLLHEDRAYVEWRFSSVEELAALHDAILEDLKRYAIPFLEKYSHVEEGVKAVASSDRHAWFGWNVDTRVNFLAVARLVKGDRAGAIEMLDEALLERKDSRPQDRYEIERVRKRLVSHK